MDNLTELDYLPQVEGMGKDGDIILCDPSSLTIGIGLVQKSHQITTSEENLIHLFQTPRDEFPIQKFGNHWVPNGTFHELKTFLKKNNTKSWAVPYKEDPNQLRNWFIEQVITPSVTLTLTKSPLGWEIDTEKLLALEALKDDFPLWKEADHIVSILSSSGFKDAISSSLDKSLQEKASDLQTLKQTIESQQNALQPLLAEVNAYEARRDQTGKEAESAQHSLEMVQKNLAEAKATTDNLCSQQISLQKQLSELEEEISNKQQALNEVSKTLLDRQQQVQKLSSQVDAKVAELKLVQQTNTIIQFMQDLSKNMESLGEQITQLQGSGSLSTDSAQQIINQLKSAVSDFTASKANLQLESIDTESGTNVSLPDSSIDQDEALEDYFLETHKKQVWNDLRRLDFEYCFYTSTTLTPSVKYAYEFAYLLGKAKIMHLHVACDWTDFQEVIDHGFFDFLKEADNNKNSNYILILDNINIAPVESYLMPLLLFLNRETPSLAGVCSEIPENVRIFGVVLPIGKATPGLPLSKNLFRNWSMIKRDEQMLHYIDFPKQPASSGNILLLNQWGALRKANRDSCQKVDEKEAALQTYKIDD